MSYGRRMCILCEEYTRNGEMCIRDRDTPEGLVKQIEAKVWQGNIPMEQLARWEHRLRVVNLSLIHI